MNADQHAWAHTLEGLHAQAWTLLSRGVHDRQAAARNVILATVTPRGLPHARTVVLRAADKASGSLRIYTDLHSAKVAELRGQPLAAIHVWDKSAHLQIRLQTKVKILTGPDVATLWNQIPDHARRAYGSTPPPGQQVPDALAYTKTPDPASFAVLHLDVHDIDLLHLGPDHRRARFTRTNGWVGQWLAP